MGNDSPASESTDSEAGSEPETGSNATRRNLFPLPEVQRPRSRVSCGGEPLIDYIKSIIMTSDDYIAAVTAKAQRKDDAARECEERKIQAEQNKARREEEKARKEADKVLRRIQMDRKKAEREREKARKAADCAQKPPDVAQRRRAHAAAGANIGGLAAQLGDEPPIRSKTIARATATSATALVATAWRGNQVIVDVGGPVVIIHSLPLIGARASDSGARL